MGAASGAIGWGLAALVVAGCQLAPASLPAPGHGVPSGTIASSPAQGCAGSVRSASGCTAPGSSGAPPSAMAAVGQLRLVVHWPTGAGSDLAGYHVQLIPDSTSRIVVTASSGSVVVATGQAIRQAGQATSSLDLTIPVSNNLGILAQAFAASASTPIAQGAAAGVSILQSKITDLSLTMGSLYAPVVTTLSDSVARPGDTLQLSSGAAGSLAVPWAATPEVLFCGATASQSAAVTVVSSTSLSVTVPAQAVSGPIAVVDDGVAAANPPTVWLASSLGLGAWGSLAWYYYDPDALATQILLPGSQSTFSSTPTWILAPGATAAGAPVPVWSSSNPQAGSFQSPTGLSDVFVAGSTILATTSFEATLGTLVATTESNSDPASAEIENVSFSLGASATRIGPTTSTDSVVFSPVNTFSDGSTLSVSTLTSSDAASLSLSVLTENANLQAVTTLGKIADWQHEGAVTVAAQSGVDPTQLASASVVLAGYRSTTPAAGSLSGPEGIAVDGAGDVYVADTANGRIQEMPAGGSVSTLASGLSFPEGIALDGAGDVLAANSAAGTVVRIDSHGNQTVVAGTTNRLGYGGDGGPATASGALLDDPWSVSVDAAGDLFIADTFNERVRMVPAASGIFYGQAMTAGDLYTIAGDGTGTFGGDGGPATSAGLVPYYTSTDASGDLYISDDNSSQSDVRVVSPAGNISTLAVLGKATDNPSHPVYGLAISPAGNVVAVVGNDLEAITPAGGVMPLAGLAGDASGAGDGIGSAIGFNGPYALAFDTAGNLWVADTGNDKVRELTPGP